MIKKTDRLGEPKRYLIFTLELTKTSTPYRVVRRYFHEKTHTDTSFTPGWIDFVPHLHDDQVNLYRVYIKYWRESKLQIIMASMTNMFPAAAAVISGINLLNIFTNVILQDYRPKKQPCRSTSSRKPSIGEMNACATRSRLPGIRFHTGKSMSFPFEFSRRNEIFVPVKQPWWTRTYMSPSSMTYLVVSWQQIHS